jgi:hypothetical protein
MGWPIIVKVAGDLMYINSPDILLAISPFSSSSSSSSAFLCSSTVLFYSFITSGTSPVDSVLT